MKNLFYDSRSSDPEVLALIRANFTLLYGPKECEIMIEFMVNEARNYSTPIGRRALTNLENLRNYNEPTQDSTFSTLVDKPNHSYLVLAFSDSVIFQRAFLAVVPLLRKHCSCVNHLICKDC